MSQGSINPPPSVPADWSKYVQNFVTVAAIIVAAWLHGNSVSPKPAPIPDGGGGNVQPVPTPPPAPPVPMACITLTDAGGNPINGTVDYGQLLHLSAEKAIKANKSAVIWTVDPAVQRVNVDDGSILLVTPKTQTTLTITQTVSLNDTLSTAQVKVQVGTAPQPPPNPQPKPIDPIPTPQPTPIKPTTVNLYVVEDSNNRSPATAKLLNHLQGMAALTSNGNTWRRFDFRDDTPAGQRAIQAIKATGKYILKDQSGKDTMPQPVLIIEDSTTSQQLSLGLCPTDDNTLKVLVNQYVGVKL